MFASHRQQLSNPVLGRAGTACRGSGTTAVVPGRDLLAAPAQDFYDRLPALTLALRRVLTYVATGPCAFAPIASSGSPKARSTESM